MFLSNVALSVHSFRMLMLAILASACLSGCGSDKDDAPRVNTSPDIPEVTTTQSQSEALDASGGDVSLSITNGAQFLLEVPIGALAEAQTLRLTSRPTSSGQYFNLLLEPAGLIFQSGAQAVLTITLPSGVSLSSSGGLAYAGAPVPFEVLDDGRLQVALSSFAESAVAPTVAGGLRAQSVRAAAVDCGDTPSASTFSDDGLVAVDHIEVELYGACMVSAINELLVQEQYTQAIATAEAVAAYLQKVGAGDPTTHLEQARTATCLGYRAALDRALETSVNSMGTLHELVRPILFWESISQRLGASCDGIASDEYQSVVSAKTDEALVYYDAHSSNLTDPESSGYLEARAEARDSLETEQQVLALDPPAAVAETVQEQVAERAQVSILDALLQAPWEACRVSQNFAPLITLMNELGAPDAVREAAHYCGVQLNALTRDADDELLATLTPALGGVGVGQVRSSGSLSVASDGTLELSGPILSLGCPVGHAGTESLEIRLEGELIQTISTGHYLTTALTLDVADMLDVAGIMAESFSQADLTIERTGSPCADFWGVTPSPLLTLRLLKAGVCAPASGEAFCLTELAPGAPTTTFNVVGPNDRGEVVLRHFSSAHERWYRGEVTELPTDFYAVGIDNSGNIAGNIFWQPGPSMGFLTNAAIVPADSSTATVLKSSVAATCSTNPCPDMDSVGSSARLMSISPNGRVLIRTELDGRVASGNGACLFESAYNTYYCRTRTWEAAEGPGFSLSTLQSTSLPDPILDHTVLWDGDEQGIVGSVLRTTLDVCSGSVCGTSSNRYAMLNLTPLTGMLNSEYAYVDTNGNRVIATPNTLEPSNVNLPSGWFVNAMGTQGDALLCSAVYTGSNSVTARLVNIHTSSVAAEVALPWTITHDSAAYTLNLCNSSAGSALMRMDRHGRFAVQASNGPDTSMVIVTPQGKPLP